MKEAPAVLNIPNVDREAGESTEHVQADLGLFALTLKLYEDKIFWGGMSTSTG